MTPTSRLHAAIVGVVFAAVTLAVSAQVDLRPSLGTLWFASAPYVPGGVITVNTTAASNGTTVETDLMTYSLAAGALSANGKGVRISAGGAYAATANTKTIKIYFGSTVVATGGTSTSGGAWTITAVVWRTGAATQVANGQLTTTVGPFNTDSAPTETLSGAITLKITGQSNAASSDVTAKMFWVEALP